jgi:hypothetical protein
MSDYVKMSDYYGVVPKHPRTQFFAAQFGKNKVWGKCQISWCPKI